MIFALITAGSVVFDLVDLSTWIGEDDDEVMEWVVTFLVYGRALDKASHRFLIDGTPRFDLSIAQSPTHQIVNSRNVHRHAPSF